MSDNPQTTIVKAWQAADEAARASDQDFAHLAAMRDAWFHSAAEILSALLRIEAALLENNAALKAMADAWAKPQGATRDVMPTQPPQNPKHRRR